MPKIFSRIVDETLEDLAGVTRIAGEIVEYGRSSSGNNSVCAVSLEEILTEFKTILSLQTNADAILNDTIRNGKKSCDCP